MRLPLLFALTVCTASMAGSLQDQLQKRWEGAWILLKTTTHSNCSGAYTNNHVTGATIAAEGAYSFARGELGRIKKVDVKRKGLDILIDLTEPRLIAYQDGPFELYREAQCPLELKFEFPRKVIKTKDVKTIEAAMTALFQRHDSPDAARASGAWNQRRMAAYPDDYEQTLAEHEAWVLSQRVVAASQRIAQLLDQADEILQGFDSSEGYAGGFARGVLAYKKPTGLQNRDCLANHDLQFYPAQPPSSGKPQRDASLYKQGYRDGQMLTFSVELAEHLQRCLDSL